jgi:SAM-dependent methyltransferase
VLRGLTGATMDKPFAESCVQNRAPIVAVLRERLRDSRSVLEIGSGTGQHAVYFAPDLPHLVWQTSDRRENHPAIRAWLDEAALPNLLPPLALDVEGDPWPDRDYDAVFSANTAHIMHEAAVIAMFEGVGRVLNPGGLFLLYGPFNVDGRYTAQSNADFDAMLRSRDPGMGVRDTAWLDRLAAAADMQAEAAVEMPADNRIQVWRKS